MQTEQEGGEVRITFRPAGWGRFLLLAFLLFWLAGWFVGEVVAIWFIFQGARGGLPWLIEVVTHPMGWIVGAFLLTWLAAWTVGGVFTIIEVLRLLFGVDRLSVSPSTWKSFRGVGSIGRERVFDREAIRELYLLGRTGPLFLETSEGRFQITAHGTLEDRRAVVERYAPPRRDGEADLPLRWVSFADHAGITHIRNRRFESPGCLIAVLVLALFFAGFAVAFPSMIPGWAVGLAATLGVLFFALFAWGLLSRREWLVGRDSIELQTTWLTWSKHTPYDLGSLRIERSVDTDGDEAVALVATTRGKRTIIYRDLNEDRDVLGLARFIEKHSGWSVGLPSELKPQ